MSALCSPGPWTTSLDNRGSRLEVTAISQRRMQAVAARAKAPRLTRRELGAAVVAAVLIVATPPLDWALVYAADGDDRTTASNGAWPPGEEGDFVARFSNGVEIELIGVSTSPSADKSWRRPDGEALATAPYRPVGAGQNVWNSPMLREICWRWRGVGSPDIRTSWHVEESTNGWGPVRPGDADGNLIKDLAAFVVPFTGIHPTCTLRFTMSRPGRDWEHFHEQPAGNVSAYVSHPNGVEATGVTFDKPRELAGDAFVVMGYILPEEDEVRLIAVDNAGRRHLGAGEFAGGIMDFRQLAVHFDNLRQMEIRTWVVERRTRVTEVALFRNVSLDPLHPTLVQIVTLGVNSDNQLAVGAVERRVSAIDVEAISDFGPVIEATVYDDRKGHDYLIDFETGETMAAEPVDTDAEGAAWLATHGVDACGQVGIPFTGLLGVELWTFPCKPENWDAAPKTWINDFRYRGTIAPAPVPLEARETPPATFLFKTREGAYGILQITEIIRSEAVKIRYKLAQP
jgi:hypothetical protein